MTPGFCNRFERMMGGRLWEICQNIDCQDIDRNKYLEVFARTGKPGDGDSTGIKEIKKKVHADASVVSVLHRAVPSPKNAPCVQRGEPTGEVRDCGLG